MIFGGEAEGIVCSEGVIGDGGGGDGTGDGTEGGVVVVCCDTIARFKVHHLRHILIAVTGVKEFIARATLSEKRPRSDGFRRIPCRMSP